MSFGRPASLYRVRIRERLELVRSDDLREAA